MHYVSRARDASGGSGVIKLTRLGGEAFILNAELIRYVEARPDTFITLVSGERLVVRESMDEVVTRTVNYQREKHLFPSPAPDRWATAASAPRN
jgi:flagellar protein FlbD